MLGPGDEIGGREAIEVSLSVVAGRCRGIDPVGVVPDNGFGVGIPAGEDGIAGENDWSGGGTRRGGVWSRTTGEQSGSGEEKRAVEMNMHAEG